MSESMSWYELLGWEATADRDLTASASPSRVTTVLEYSPDAYVVQNQPKYFLRLTQAAEFEPLACFRPPSGPVTEECILDLYDKYLQNDDVFCKRFLKTTLLVTDEVSLDDSVLSFLASVGCLVVFLVRSEHKVEPGPYFFSRRGIFWAWRLFPDYQEAFILSTIPSQEDPNLYENLNASAFEAATLCIAVPSRLYFNKTPELPLAGTRIAIKDLFHLNGVHTGCGNRAYRRLYSASKITSSQVQDAISKGAIVIGKTKTVEFGLVQEVIGDWPDYSYALNARGDGYLAATGSSTGSASALAAYPFLDITLGTDAAGSIRDPSVAHGIYGLRPSHDRTPARDAVIPCSIFNTPGYMGRSCQSMLEFGHQWFAGKPKSDLVPIRLMFPPDYYASHDGVQKLAENWVDAFSLWLKIKIDRIPIAEKWTASKPTNIQDGFFQVFSKQMMDLVAIEYWKQAAQFREDYQRTFHSAAFVCQVTQWLWNKGKAMSPEYKKQLIHEVDIHNKWFSENISKNEDFLMCFPRFHFCYRDEYQPAPEFRDYYGFDSNLHASYTGLPHIIVPLGQCAYFSDYSKRAEMFPVSLSIVGPKGKDLALIQLVNDFLSDMKLPMSVLTGTVAFDNKR